MKRSLTTVLAAVTVAVGLTSTAFADGPWGRRGGDHHPLAWRIVMGVIVAAVVGLVVYLVVRRPAAGSPASQAVSPTASGETILAERLARGEIGPDDYRTLLAALKGEQAPTPSS